LVSLLSGECAQAGDFVTPEYWVRQLREAVRFSDGMRTLERAGVRSYLECGPDGVLVAMGAPCVGEEARMIAALRKGQDEERSLMVALGGLHVAGQTLDLREVLKETPGACIDLPTYAFQRQSYWHALKHVSTGSVQDEDEGSEWLDGLSADELPAHVLAQLTAWVIDASPSSEPSADTQLMELGFDSLAALELANRVQRLLGVSLSPRDMLQYSSLGALSRHIAELYTQQKGASAPAVVRRDSALIDTGKNRAHGEPGIARAEHWLPLSDGDHCVSTWGDPADPPVLCLHGYGDQGPIWGELAACLTERGMFVVAPDLKGHGLSPHALPGQGGNLTDFVADVSGLLAAMELREVLLVGHSLGALIAAACAVRQSARIQTLVLVDPVLPSVRSGAPAQARHGQEAQLPGAQPVFASEQDALRVFEQFHPSLPEGVREQLVRRLLVEVPAGFRWRNDPYAIALASWPGEAECLSLLGQVQAASSVVFGESSVLVSQGKARRIANALRTGSLHGLPGGHWIHYEQSERLAELITALFEQRLATARAG
jgi:pimeloyl-ACP methyl ester carboxylesterase/acyl carrier protein